MENEISQNLFTSLKNRRRTTHIFLVFQQRKLFYRLSNCDKDEKIR